MRKFFTSFWFLTHFNSYIYPFIHCSGSSSSSSNSISGSSRTKKKEEKDTQNTQNKKKQRMKTDKKNCGNFFTSFWFLTQFNSYLSINTL